MDRLCQLRGYRSTTHLITMLYFVAGKLRFPSSDSTENSGEPCFVVHDHEQEHIDAAMRFL